MARAVRAQPRQVRVAVMARETLGPIQASLTPCSPARGVLAGARAGGLRAGDGDPAARAPPLGG